ncbi:MAG TPA: PfkB family carbohydrate kinase [Puia sp.]|nr:PfkB family carbohydrate kinase [Puia sp.]
MYDICCIGHITLDKVITEKGTVHMAGGTSFYFSNAIRSMDVRYQLITTLAKEEMYIVSELRAEGIEVHVPSFSAHTVYFENDYSEGMDNRTQRVLQQSVPFTAEQLTNISARIFHLGPLLADDIPLETIEALSKKGTVSLDIQGYLRRVENKKVFLNDWVEKKEAFPFVHILKANEPEMYALTGCTDVREAAVMLFEWGVKEIIITLGSRGSVIYNGVDFYEIPAYSPVTSVVDATGCGDTYMAGYLYQRIKGNGYQHAGEFAAAMATLKIESSGPFTGTEKNVRDLLLNCKRKVFLDL